MKIGDRRIELNGILWDTENFSINNKLYFNKIYFTRDEAVELINHKNKRLPTNEELSDLFDWCHQWDGERKGVWFANKHNELGTSKSLFLPAIGSSSILSPNEGFDIGFKGRYWSANTNRVNNPYYLWFRDKNHDLEYGTFSQMLSIRLVQDI